MKSFWAYVRARAPFFLPAAVVAIIANVIIGWLLQEYWGLPIEEWWTAPVVGLSTGAIAGYVAGGAFLRSQRRKKEP